MSITVTVTRVLQVARDFDLHGGLSADLLAWELAVEEDDVAAAWASALERGLLIDAGPALPIPAQYEVEIPDTPMLRLSPAGWAELGIDPGFDSHRAEVVDETGLLEDELTPAFAALARTAVALLGTTGSGIHIFDERYMHRIAGLGAPLATLAAHNTFCRLAVDSGAAIVSDDAGSDERFSYSVFSRMELPFRFYAAAPLRAGDDDTVIGTLCVFDTEARALTDEERGRLDDLALLAEAQIELGRLARQDGAPTSV